MPREKSLLAGKTLTIKSGELAGQEITIEDWWENVYGESWQVASVLNPAAVQYAMRQHRDNLPLNDEVLYGKIHNFGYLVHLSELD